MENDVGKKNTSFKAVPKRSPEESEDHETVWMTSYQMGFEMTTA
jgi:hypothetical protein